MQTSRTRLIAVAATTLTLVASAGAAVAANHDDDDELFGFGGERLRPLEQRFRPFEQRLDRRSDARLGVRGLVAGAFDGLVRSETTFQTDDGIVTRRVDNGAVSSTSDDGLEYSLATGEVASVRTDDDTQVIAFSEESVDFGRGFSRTRLVPEAIAIGDIAAGSEVVVWALAQEDGSFLAERIVVRPATDDTADAAEDEALDAAEDVGEADPSTAESGAATDDAEPQDPVAGPEDSPAPVDA
jgi:hypothetical protein